MVEKSVLKKCATKYLTLVVIQQFDFQLSDSYASYFGLAK